MNKIEKQSVPMFFNELGEPIAVIIYIKGHRVIHLLKEADEDELIDLYEKKDTHIKTNKSITNNN